MNLPVHDLARSVGFFGSLGFAFNEQFTDENAACMVVSDQACVMLLARPFFATFTTKPIAADTTETIVALSAASRADVDTLVDTAIAQGGEPAMAPADEGFMYGRSFYDLDGHAWEVIWMEPVGQRVT